jgi:hypothetical protein
MHHETDLTCRAYSVATLPVFIQHMCAHMCATSLCSVSNESAAGYLYGLGALLPGVHIAVADRENYIDAGRLGLMRCHLVKWHLSRSFCRYLHIALDNKHPVGQSRCLLRSSILRRGDVDYTITSDLIKSLLTRARSALPRKRPS